MSTIRTEDWDKIKEIYYAASQMALDEREAYLSDACASDPNLRVEIDSLLSSFDAAGTFMNDPAVSEVADSIVGTGSRFQMGTKLGNYTIQKLLGVGGMGQVYFAMDAKLKRGVAIKILPIELTTDRTISQRFEQEALAASALNHPNILTIYEIGEFDKASFIVSEFVDGETLREKLNDGPLPFADALNIAIQTATALAVAHESGIIHRDIKPENIMIRRDRLVKLLDFGIAKLTAHKPPSDAEADTRAQVQTAAGVLMGTAPYMSPEQVRAAETDSRTDIWSLGVVFFEMLTGHQPFVGDTLSDTIAMVLKSEPLPLTYYVHNLPAELDRIVAKTLRKRADDRYQDVTALMEDLEEIRQTLGFAARQEVRLASESSSPAPILQSTANAAYAHFVGAFKNHKFIISAFVTVLLLTAAIGTFYFYGNRKFSDQQTIGAPFDSIAVLPFENATQDAGTEYLSDGITDSLINRLSLLSNLRVMSRASVFRYKGYQQDPQKVGKELNVQTVLTGSVKQVGEELVVNVSLDDAQSNRHIWGEQYVRKFEDILNVQSDITQEVSTYLRIKLTGADHQHITKRYTENIEAYQLYLKGQYEWNKHTEEDLRKSIEYYKQSLEKDQDFALAYAGLSAAQNVMGSDYLPPNEAIPQAKIYAAKALSIDDMLAEGHVAMAAVNLFYDWHWAEAEKELTRAQVLDPNNTLVHHLNGDRLEIEGRFEEAKAEREQALRLDPLSPLESMAAGATFYFAGQNDEAIAQNEKTINLEPRFYPGYFWLGQAYTQKNMYGKAIEVYQNGIAKAERNSQLVAALGHAYARAGEIDKANQTLDELNAMSKGGYVDPYLFAFVYNGLGDRDKTFAWLEKAYQNRSYSLIWLMVEPQFKPLRYDPRFQDLSRRVGL